MNMQQAMKNPNAAFASPEVARRWPFTSLSRFRDAGLLNATRLVGRLHP